MTDLTPAQREAYARAKSTVVHIWALEFRHVTFADHIRIVQNRNDVTFSLEADAPANPGESKIFIGTGLRVGEPEISTEVDSTLSIQIDGVSGIIQNPFTVANKTAFPVECAARPISYDVITGTVGQILGRLDLQVRSLSLNMTSVNVKLGYTNTANRPFPYINYTPQSNPGLIS